MDEFEKLDVSLPQEAAAIIRDAVRSGEYASSGEVVSDALHSWQHNRAVERDISHLRKLIAEGHASGSEPWKGADHLIAEARRRYKSSSE